MPSSCAHQCHPSVSSSASSQCHQSVLPHQCPSVLPISDHHCSIISDSSLMPTSAASSAKPISAHQCYLSMPPHQCPSVLPI
ncbi:unnamed protein product, partial [Staurois parvus]